MIILFKKFNWMPNMMIDKILLLGKKNLKKDNRLMKCGKMIFLKIVRLMDHQMCGVINILNKFRRLLILSWAKKLQRVDNHRLNNFLRLLHHRNNKRLELKLDKQCLTVKPKQIWKNQFQLSNKSQFTIQPTTPRLIIKVFLPILCLIKNIKLKQNQRKLFKLKNTTPKQLPNLSWQKLLSSVNHPPNNKCLLLLPNQEDLTTLKHSISNKIIT